VSKKKPNVIHQFIEALKANHYVIELTRRPGYDFYQIKGLCIMGGFCTPVVNKEMVYPEINGKIAVDHKKAFDKWRKCPFVHPLPQSEKDIKWIIERMKFWGTDEGYEISNTYQWEKWDNPLYKEEHK
jgi:hypothetical protein